MGVLAELILETGKHKAQLERFLELTDWYFQCAELTRMCSFLRINAANNFTLLSCAYWEIVASTEFAERILKDFMEEIDGFINKP